MERGREGGRFTQLEGVSKGRKNGREIIYNWGREGDAMGGKQGGREERKEGRNEGKKMSGIKWKNE